MPEDPTPTTRPSSPSTFDPIFKGTGEKRFAPGADLGLPPPPAWRRADRRKAERGATFQARPEEIELVNAALYLRRPLLVTGKPGTGKTSLAYAIARELGLGEVLYWPITTRTTLKDGLYLYDAIARLQDASGHRSLGSKGDGAPAANGDGLGDRPESNRPESNRSENDRFENDRFENIGDYIRLGPLGTALLPSRKPRILIVDEIDKSDIDLPNDLLSVFEEGEFEIPELVRIEKTKREVEVRTAYKDPTEDLTFNRNGITDGKATIVDGRVASTEFPLLVLTSNGERDFPPPFLRRCIRMTMAEPDTERLTAIVNAHLAQQQQLDAEDIQNRENVTGCEVTGRELTPDTISQLIAAFERKRNQRDRGDLATDQLLNAIYLVLRERDPEVQTRDELIQRLWKHLNSSED